MHALLLALLIAPVAACGQQTWQVDVTSAELSAPVSRYGHGVFGPSVSEKETLTATGADGQSYTVTLASNVFEDTTARIADVTGNGTNEIVVVETALDKGASLAVYAAYSDGTLQKIAATPYIGTSHRWLAPAGIADFDGDGQNDVAYVETPHLGRTLRIVTYENGRMVEVASAGGFTNHRFGDSVIQGGVRDCGAVPEVLLADSGWNTIVAAHLSDGRIVAESVGTYGGPSSLSAALSCN